MKASNPATQETAVITGGASGIGKAVAEILTGRGVAVCIVDLDGDSARQVSTSLQNGGGRVFAWQTDVTDSESVQRTFGEIREKAGPVSMMITCAGIPGHGAVTELSDQRWREVL